MLGMSPIFRRRPDPAGPPDEPTRIVRAGEPGAPPAGERWVEEEVADGPVVEEEVVEERAPERRPPLIWPWLLLLLLLVLAGLGALWYFTREDDKATVPSVVRMQETEAVRRVEGANLEPVVTRRANEAPRGQVFAQTPGGGSQLEEGEAVTLLVSRGPGKVAVPNVVGLPVDDARERLSEAKLKEQVRRVFSEEPVGVVIAQDPAAGERADSGSPVRINVSKGTGRVEVPDVVGQTADDAGANLRKAGLEAKVFDVPSAEPEGTVVAQNPPSGSELGKGDTVRINVSTGEGAATTPTDTGTETDTTAAPPPPPAGGSTTVAVPAAVGKPVRAAQRQVRAAGLTVRIDYVASTRPANVVVSQNPAAGRDARRGSTVLLRVSSGPNAARVAVPDVVGLTTQEAAAELRAAGFQVEVFTEQTPDAAEEGLVIRQEPGASRQAPRGALVTIYVGRFTG